MKKKSFLIDNGNLSKINNKKIVKINIKMYVSKFKMSHMENEDKIKKYNFGALTLFIKTKIVFLKNSLFFFCFVN